MGRSENLCDCDIIHSELVEKAKQKTTGEQTLRDMLCIYKAMADGTRLKIIDVLHDGSLCVCDISALLNKTKSAISHQLKYLRQIDIVKSKKVGKEVWYSLADNHILKLFDVCLSHALEEKNV